MTSLSHSVRGSELAGRASGHVPRHIADASLVARKPVSERVTSRIGQQQRAGGGPRRGISTRNAVVPRVELALDVVHEVEMKVEHAA